MGADICSGFAVTVVIVMAAMVGVLVEITALVYSGREIGVGTGVATKMIELVGREFGYGLLLAIQILSVFPQMLTDAHVRLRDILRASPRYSLTKREKCIIKYINL
ncbi:hypothetical protein YC2023_118277 [Brassica napus]